MKETEIKKNKIYLASDHAGFDLKNYLIEYLNELEFEVEDLGAVDYKRDDDYPDFVSLAAKKVSEKPEEVKGIILGGSGQGEAMVANRFDNVRATVYYGGNLNIIKLSREHNNANILSLGARFVDDIEAKRVVKMWLETPFGEEKRHIRRIEKIEKTKE